jgi:MFS family permease
VNQALEETSTIDDGHVSRLSIIFSLLRIKKNNIATNMCAPTSSEESTIGTSTKVDGETTLSDAEKKSNAATHKGFLYGTISLASVVTAGSVTMGHYQSRRNELGCDAMCVGSMTSARSMLTLMGATIIGRWSDSRAFDHIGGARRLFLFLGIAALGLDLFLSSTATTLPGLWMSMIPSALFQQNFNVLKALFGEYHLPSASAADRAGSVGKLGMAVGLAFMAGPLVSSTLLQTYNAAALFGGVCLVIATIFIWLLPSVKREKETSQNIENDRGEESSKPSTGILAGLLPDLVPAARTPPAIFIATARLCMGLAFHIFQTIWTVALRERFQFGPTEYSRYFGFIGLTFAISQGFLAKFIIQRFAQTDRGRARILLLCALALGGGRLFAYQTHNLTFVFCLFGAIVTALGVVNTIFTADTSKIADPQDLGGLFGVLASVESIAGIVGPVLGGALAKVHPVQGPLIAVLSLYGVVFTLVYWGYERIVCHNSKTVAGKKD